jgi:hypothetical protein
MEYSYKSKAVLRQQVNYLSAPDYDDTYKNMEYMPSVHVS